jgi:hypothetical protein
VYRTERIPVNHRKSNQRKNIWVLEFRNEQEFRMKIWISERDWRTMEVETKLNEKSSRLLVLNILEFGVRKVYMPRWR